MPNIMEITDFHASGLDVYARLSEGQLLHYHEPDAGLFIAESPKVIERALCAGYEPVSLLMEKRHVEGEARDVIARCGDIHVYTAEFDVLKQLTGFPLTRGVLCAMKRRRLPTVRSLCEGAARIAILENIMNPTNVGAIFRSAAALSMDAVLLTPGCSDPLYRRAVRVSMGTVFQIAWTYFEKESDSRPQSWVNQLKHAGFKTVAMALDSRALRIDDPRLAGEEKLAVILGSEGDGLPQSTVDGCDYIVRIPMSHGVDSLNVAAASAVAFWQLGAGRQL